MTTSWRETHLPTTLSRYKLEDIFNADEFGPCFEQYLTKFWNWKGKNAAVVNTTKSDWLGGGQRVL